MSFSVWKRSNFSYYVFLHSSGIGVNDTLVLLLCLQFQKKMLDNFGEMCKTEHLFDSSEHNLKPLSENGAKVHIEESAPPVL